MRATKKPPRGTTRDSAGATVKGSTRPYGVVRGISSRDDFGVPQEWQKAARPRPRRIFYESPYTNGDLTAHALFGRTGKPDPSAGFTAEEYLSGVHTCVEVDFEVEHNPLPAGIMLI